MTSDETGRYIALFDSIDDAIFVHQFLPDAFGTFVEMNRAACERYGYSRDELMTMGPANISVPTDGEPSAGEGVMSVLRDKGRAVFQTIHKTRQGGVPLKSTPM